MSHSIHITDIEAAINHWRDLKPSPDGVTLAPELRALAEVYALMIYHHQDEAAEKGFPAKAYAAWRATSCAGAGLAVAWQIRGPGVP